MNKAKLILVGIVLTALSACTPADVEYCSKFGVAGTPEYGKCISYFHQQENLFNADLDGCNIAADAVYPPYLYDYGHTEHIHGGYGPYGYYGGTTINVEPDYQHNAQVTALRHRIIDPCMMEKGWNSGTTWQAGRHAVSKTPKADRPVPVESLPWK